MPFPTSDHAGAKTLASKKPLIGADDAVNRECGASVLVDHKSVFAIVVDFGGDPETMEARDIVRALKVSVLSASTSINSENVSQFGFSIFFPTLEGERLRFVPFAIPKSPE